MTLEAPETPCGPYGSQPRSPPKKARLGLNKNNDFNPLLRTAQDRPPGGPRLAGQFCSRCVAAQLDTKATHTRDGDGLSRGTGERPIGTAASRCFVLRRMGIPQRHSALRRKPRPIRAASLQPRRCELGL